MEKPTLINKRKIQSYLPVFPGFYSTIFEPDEENLIEDPYDIDCYEFDYNEYREKMGKAMCDIIEEKLKEICGGELTIHFERISSPREYNFANDTVYCTYIFNDEFVLGIENQLKKHNAHFAKFIKDHYTSYDGFMSSYSNDKDVWLNEYFQSDRQLQHCFGQLMNFILTGYSDENLYYDVVDDHNVYLEGGLKKEVVEINDYIHNLTIQKYGYASIEAIAKELDEYFGEQDLQDKYDFLTKDFITKSVTNIFKEIDNKSLTLF